MLNLNSLLKQISNDVGKNNIARGGSTWLKKRLFFGNNATKKGNNFVYNELPDAASHLHSQSINYP